MSLYLGKIHYWLYNKILWFEGLEEEIIKIAKQEKLDINKLLKNANEHFGEKLPNKPLEEIIDTNNIHGWLQERIHSAEGRMAYWIRLILDKDKNSISKIEKVYIDQGLKAGKECLSQEIDLLNAKNIYNKINDYILDGMPCDRVNEIIESNEDIVSWKRRICVHKDIWHDEVELFYQLRSLWIKSFINTVNNEFKYVEDDGVNKIERV
ncbi:hypothetical protein EAI30_14850 [Romboutsia ilealis]|uniref:Uncharacterized protein n=1 Tax=Romboutsia faecis TaxID=2764597 RepID=A0ABR7JJT9_9FIRM|nr:hypothetical protein [Romboutsia faecis]MBC5995177.1 hypothetical protein [Romboutsia faecis]MRN25895.1 hypothetical protein [Romboutsia ilealis]